MKNINVFIDDKEYELALKNKGDRTWKEVLMGMSKKEADIKIKKQLKKEFEFVRRKRK